MPVFRITGPDGTTYRITGPEGSTADDAGKRVKAQYAAGQAARASADPRSVAEQSPMYGAPREAKTDARVAGEIGRDALDAGYAFVQGVGRGALNAGGLVGSATNPNYEEDRAARAGRNPVASTVGDIAGTAATGRTLMRGLGMAGNALARVVGRTPEAAGEAAGTVRKVANYFGVGAAGGAAASATTGQDIPTGAAAGALGSAVVGAPAATLAIGRAVIGKLAPASLTAYTNAIRFLSSKMEEDPDQLMAAAQQFAARTGKIATLQEIQGAGSAAELVKLAEARRSAADVFRQSEQDITAARPASMQRQIERGGPVDTTARLRGVRDAAGDAAMQRIGNIAVRLPQRVMDLIAHGEGYQSIGPALRARVASLSQGGPPLTVREVENIRKSIADAAGDATGKKHVYTEIAGELATEAGRQVPAYGSFLSESSAFARNIKGFEHGEGSKLPGAVKDRLDRVDTATPEYAAGRNVGVRTRLANEAGATEDSAKKVAKTLAQPSGAATEAQGALSAREQRALQELGQAETQSAERLSGTGSVPVRPLSDERALSVKNLVEGVTALFGKTLTGYKSHVAARIMTRLSISPATARQVAEAATDARNIPQVIDALRRARLTDAEITSILMPVAAAGGQVAGGQEQ